MRQSVSSRSEGREGQQLGLEPQGGKVNNKQMFKFTRRWQHNGLLRTGRRRKHKRGRQRRVRPIVIPMTTMVEEVA